MASNVSYGNNADNTERQNDLLAKQRNLEGLFSDFYGEIDESRKFYKLDFKEQVVPDRWRGKLHAFIPPHAQHAIDEAVDHILFTPRVKVMTRPAEAAQALEEQTIAENKRSFIAAIWQNETVIHDARKTLINEGMIAIKQTLNWQYIPKKPGKGAKASEKTRYRRELAKLGADKKIWEHEILDNKSITYGPVNNHRDPWYVYIKYDISTEEAKRLFPRAGDNFNGLGNQDTNASPDKQAWRNQSDLENVEYIELWTRDICDEYGEIIEEGAYLQFINGACMRDEPNPYPYIPIAIEDSGFGEIRATAKPHDIFVGMTNGMRETFRAQAKQFTAWESVTEMSAFGLFIARNRDPNKVWNLGPGEILDLEGNEKEPGSESFEAVKLPEIPLGVIQLVQETNRIANSTLKTETLGGQPLSGVETATEADQQIRNASAKLASPVAALERLVAKLSEWIFICIEDVIEAPVTVWAVPAGSGTPSSVTVKPSDIRGYHKVTAELRTTDEEAVNMVKARFWAEMYRVIPFLSAWTAMEKGEISDQPQQELVRRASENVFLSPQMDQIRTMVGAEAFGELAMIIQQLASGGSSGPGGESASTPTGAAPSEPMGGMGNMGGSVPAASAGGAGAARDILQGPSQIRGPRDAGY